MRLVLAERSIALGRRVWPCSTACDFWSACTGRERMLREPLSSLEEEDQPANAEEDLVHAFVGDSKRMAATAVRWR